MSNTDISSSINTIISTSKETGTVKTKRISNTYHTFGDLYARERVLFRLITCCYPRLAFKSLSH